jgi:hypothetical protein
MDASDSGNAEASMDVSDSRKRPMDSDLDQSIAKRSNRGDCKQLFTFQWTAFVKYSMNLDSRYRYTHSGEGVLLGLALNVTL